jgi:chaperonin GroEL
VITDLSKAKRIVVDRTTTIIDGAGADDKIRVASRRSSRDRRQHQRLRQGEAQERLAKLAGGVAVISVGAPTEAEMKEKKARVEDALHATRAAARGHRSGGGVALIRARARALKTQEADEQIGVDIIRSAIEEPIRIIVQNAVVKARSSSKVRGSKDDAFG